MNTHPLKKPPTAINEPQELEHQIRERAYELYEARGREHGHDEEDWLRAKEEITTAQMVRTQQKSILHPRMGERKRGTVLARAAIVSPAFRIRWKLEQIGRDVPSWDCRVS